MNCLSSCCGRPRKAPPPRRSGTPMAESKRTKYRLWSALNVRRLTRQGQENMTVKHNNKYFCRCLEPQIKHYAVLHGRQSSWSHQCSREEQLDLFNDQSFFFFPPPAALLAAGGALYKFRFLIIQMPVREEKAGDQHRSDCMQRLCCQRVLSLPAANRALSFF